MSGKFNYLESRVQDHMFMKSQLAQPTAIHVGLSTTTPAEDGTNITEPSGNGYARVATTGLHWNAAVDGVTSNAQAVTFPTCVTAAWSSGADMTHVVLWDQSSNPLYFGQVETAKSVGVGDTPSFAAGQLTFTED
jgi:hypothetical protein